MIAKLSVLIGCALLISIASATDIYRWVDEKGQTHVADTVPPQYQKKATKVDTSASKVSESQRAAAKARVAKEKSVISGTGTPAAAGSSGVGEIASDNKPGASGLDDKRTRCDQMRRAYRESQACFGQFGIQRGGVRGEAHQHCTEIPDPSSQCGAPTDP